MLLIRQSEGRLRDLFNDGKIPGFIHLSIGQEAVAVGVAAALERDDTLASTHRGHGHGLAKGVAPEGLFQEISGNVEGLCKGRGGSLHVADFSVGMLGANPPLRATSRASATSPYTSSWIRPAAALPCRTGDEPS